MYNTVIELCYMNNTVATEGESMVSFEKLTLDGEGPIYMQIIRYIKQGIASGVIENQEEVPSRRLLSALLGVNPNTIQKAYRILEEEGVLFSRSGAKSYICAGREQVERIRRELLQSDTEEWVRAMKQLGIRREEAVALAEKLWEKPEEEKLL